ncbi:TPA: Bcr/CflA family multidrug efflux MFS transporter [Morganella morganii]|uniref:Bcr/CflA family efflux transporter n=1 Tax=Morganella morganii subsp. morganii KT TaxID=1124991 RepID=M1SXU2_MORMO|nr:MULTISPECIES: Bcr/CflA family multidrug efflux MFS transporter [Morganella]MCJ1905746.1 Bcr/CflA family multidrug efflux MFS transporter [Morganella sp. HSTU-ASny43]AGG31807.1 MFS family multidrug transport protein, bicyclomycin resistance protein [Morganella morganii subsp. morganii KT]AMG70575.1 Bcr/CflA family drug resistance efflux transporter [Morganella morganii]AZP25100.1 Bcr/CflA family drug resistance efflux transporter [Morganella morganii]EJK8625078.1 Bcr/CflA family multidrug ef
MQVQRSAYFGLIFILGLLSMLMPLAIDMYLPSMPTIARDFGVTEGDVQMTLNSYLIGFAAGQLVYGPMADALGRKPVILGGTLIFALASAGCAMSQDIGTFIGMRGLHGFAAAAASVVINALMRDMFTKDEFSRSMSFVVLVMTVAPLLAPIMGGMMMLWFSWHAIFWTIMIAALIAALLVLFFIRETLPKERRQPFRLRIMLGQFVTLFRQKRVLCYMVASGFSFAGMFSFLSAGSFVYIQLYGLTELEFGYCFALNIVFLFIMTTINSRYVRRFGALNMLRTGLVVQLLAGCWLVLAASADLGFVALMIGVACYVGNIAMITSNAMAVILDDYPHMAGTASSLAGVLRFGIGAGVGAVVASFDMTTVWPMVGAMALCILIAASLVLYARRFA